MMAWLFVLTGMTGRQAYIEPGLVCVRNDRPSPGDGPLK